MDELMDCKEINLAMLFYFIFGRRQLPISASLGSGGWGKEAGRRQGIWMARSSLTGTSAPECKLCKQWSGALLPLQLAQRPHWEQGAGKCGGVLGMGPVMSQLCKGTHPQFESSQ